MMERKFSSRDSFAESRNPNGLSSISKVEKGRKKSAGSSGIRDIQSDEFSLSRFIFPGLPEHYPLRKKISITKANSTTGTAWDILQIFLSVLACIMYVADTYVSDYHGEYAFNMSETIITQFFMIDFSLNWYLDGTLSYLTQSMTLVDIVTILPVYLTLITGGKSTTLGFLRFVRILRLVRVFRTFKALRSLSGIKRQLLSLTLTLLSMTFLAAGLVQLMENDIQQYRYDCKYINAHTLWEPSCSQSSPADESCDCSENNCSGYYQRGDPQGKPGGIKCIRLTYFNAFYFIIVTVSTVGYGDISPSTLYSRAIVVLFIVASLVVIPMQVNRLQVLLSMRSPYRNPYKAHQQENHVILCGHVNDKSKLEKFFKEFFHPDRAFSSAPEFHAVVLCPMEPTEDVRNLILSPMLDSRVTYVIGSALTVEDLKKVRADVASGMFFLCNTEVASDHASLEDAATVMRALSVSNFNPDLDCLVQVLRPEDRTILKDSDIDVILCLDEFKTALQARNSICPGFSTFVENIFHSFGAVSPSVEHTLDPWYGEYLQGARMEMYYVPLDMDFLRAISFSFDRLCEAIYVEWGIIVLGLCSADQDEMTFNPTLKDLGDHKTFKSFFSVFNVALIMADDQMQAEQITRGLSDIAVVNGMLTKMDDEEDQFPCCPVQPKEAPADGSSSEEQRPGVLKKVPSAKLKAFATIKNNIGFGHNSHASQKFLGENILQRRSYSRVEEPLSDSDDDDEQNYVGYVSVEKQEVVKNGRRMSSGMGAGGMVGGTSNRARPLGLLGVRKPLSLGNSPIVDGSDTGRKSIRSEQRSLLAKRTTAVSVKEEDEEDDDDDDDATTGTNPSTTVGRLSGLMTNLLGPSAIAATPNATNSKPRPLLRGATVGANARANPIPIRKTLKELHEANRPSTTTTTSPTAPTSTPAPRSPPAAVACTTDASPLSAVSDKPFLNRSLNRGSTDSAITRNRSNSDEIPGPPIGTPPSPSQMLKLSSPGPVPAPLKPSQAAAEEDPVDSLMEKFGVASAVIEDKVTVDDHIIVFGNDSSLPMFISELRRPAVKGSAYHPIVVVSPELPSKWDAIKGRYNDIYVLLGSLTRSAVFNRANVDNAFAVILLATRDGVTTVEEENIDSTTLFAYLKLEQYIPRDVFFSVELTCASNMAVLNATIMRRARRNPGEYAKAAEMGKTITLMKSNVQSTVGARTRLGSDEEENPVGKTESGDNIGRFTSKRNTIRQTLKDPSIARLPTNIGRRASTVENVTPSIETPHIKEPKLEVDSAETRFWDATDTHHMLPVFASARAYVPSSFESLLVQSFFGVLTPLICEKLVCGQAGQTVLQADIPMNMLGRRFLDLFRIMSYYHIICFGLYRAPATSDKAILPYVFISPSPTTTLRYQDKMFLYGKPSRLTGALQAIERR